jgi:plastocyanin
VGADPHTNSAARDDRVLAGTAVVLAVALAGVGLALRDRESVAIAVLTLVGAALLRVRHGLAGRIALGLVFADTAAWLVPAAVGNARAHDRLGSVLLPVLISAVAVVGLLAIVLGALGRGPGGPRLTPTVAAAAWVVLAAGAMAAATAVGVGRTTTLPPGAVTVGARNTAFSTAHLRAVRAADGTVTVLFDNHDLFWHTFTVDRLGVDLKAPTRGRREVTFRARPGTYTFYCAIPGHRTAGMEGTLIVEPSR